LIVDASDPLARLGRLLGVSPDAVRRRRRAFGVFTDAMDPGDALRFERWLACVAQAAEELGPRAQPMAIMARAKDIERRPS